jgi:AcrR family transcriptional regulator
MISTTKQPTARRRLGGRSARVIHDVLEATLEELGRVGYVALTFEGVASRAQVNRTTIYRRWPTKFALVHAAMTAAHDSQPKAPDTGAIRSDLMMLARQRLETMSLPRTRAIAAAIISEPPDSELVLGTQVFRERARALVYEVVARAVARGELPANVDPEMIQQPLFSMLFGGVILRREVPDERFIERMIDALLIGAAHDANTRARKVARSAQRRPR